MIQKILQKPENAANHIWVLVTALRLVLSLRNTERYVPGMNRSEHNLLIDYFGLVWLSFSPAPPPSWSNLLICLSACLDFVMDKKNIVCSNAGIIKVSKTFAFVAADKLFEKRLEQPLIVLIVILSMLQSLQTVKLGGSELLQRSRWKKEHKHLSSSLPGTLPIKHTMTWTFLQR